MLSQVKFFKDRKFPDSTLQKLSRLASLQAFSTSQTVFEQDSTPDNFYLILAGEVRVLVKDQQHATLIAELDKLHKQYTDYQLGLLQHSEASFEHRELTLKLMHLSNEISDREIALKKTEPAHEVVRIQAGG